jgi:dTDP-4-amino-4,6-dideoxygalactose transaminase
VGSIGHVGCFSFYPTKNLGACGDGGAITTHDGAIAERLRRLRDHGRRGAYYYEELGVNSRLDAVQAAILQIKLRYLPTWNQQRCAVADRYQQFLGAVSGIVLPQISAGGQSVWNQYTIRIRQPSDQPQNEAVPFRDTVRDRLQQKNVISMVYYPLPLHLQPAYQALGYQPGQLPVSEQASHEVLSLPMFPELSAEQQEQVAYCLKDCLV